MKKKELAAALECAETLAAFADTHGSAAYGALKKAVVMYLAADVSAEPWNGTGLPPVEYLGSLLSYDEETGILRWKHRSEDQFKHKHQFVSWNNRFSGKVAGSSVRKKNKLYQVVTVKNKRMYSHRIAWALFYGEWPKGEIDHINGDSEDNSIINLRDVDRKTNCRNVSTQKDSVSGYCGVNFHSLTGKWRARVKKDGKEYYIGLFDSIEDAAEEIKKKRDELGFHDLHGRPIRTEEDKSAAEKIWAAMGEVEQLLLAAGFTRNKNTP